MFSQGHCTSTRTIPADRRMWSQIWRKRAEGKTKSGKKRKGLKEILGLCPLQVENLQGIFNLLPSILHEILCSPRKSLVLSQALVYSHNQRWWAQAGKGTAPSCLGTQPKIPNEAGWFPQDARHKQGSFSQKNFRNQNCLRSLYLMGPVKANHQGRDSRSFQKQS